MTDEVKRVLNTLKKRNDLACGGDKPSETDTRYLGSCERTGPCIGDQCSKWNPVYQECSVRTLGVMASAVIEFLSRETDGGDNGGDVFQAGETAVGSELESGGEGGGSVPDDVESVGTGCVFPVQSGNPSNS